MSLYAGYFAPHGLDPLGLMSKDEWQTWKENAKWWNTFNYQFGMGSAQTTVDGLRSIGDSVTVGGTRYIREGAWGRAGDVVDENAYIVGSVAGTAIQVFVMPYASGSKLLMIRGTGALYALADTTHGLYSVVKSGGNLYIKLNGPCPGEVGYADYMRAVADALGLAGGLANAFETAPALNEAVEEVSKLGNKAMGAVERLADEAARQAKKLGDELAGARADLEPALAGGPRGGWLGKTDDSLAMRRQGDSMPERRRQKPGDKDFPSERAARREAFRQNNVPTSQTDNFERVPTYGKNDNLKGPNGEPYEEIHTKDAHGNPVVIEHHKHGHHFKDTNEFEKPHYQGPNNEHLSYEDNR
jgi:hypothetical protein